MRYRRYAQHAAAQNRTLRAERRLRARRAEFVFFAAAALFIGPLLLYLGFRMERHQLRRGAEEMQRETLALREENRTLRAEKLRLESLARVETVARERLGMTEARPHEVTLVYFDETPAESMASGADTSGEAAP